MGYYMDLSAISLKQYADRLKNTELLPSQQVLKEDVDRRFAIIAGQGIQNILQLQDMLKTKGKVSSFAKATALPEPYLTVLRRELNSYTAQVRKIADFSSIGDGLKAGLAALSILTMEDLYDRVLTPEKCTALAVELPASVDDVLMLTKLADVSRLRYVNPPFATLLAHSAYDTVAKIKEADPLALHRELMAVNENSGFFKGRINAKDMEFLAREAGYVSLDIRYD